VEVDVEGFGDGGAGTLEGAHLPDQGESDWKGRVGRLEGDMEKGTGVYYRVDCCEFVGCLVLVSVDCIMDTLWVFEIMADHGERNDI